MKKVLLLILALSFVTILTACKKNKGSVEMFTLPDLSGKTYIESIVEINNEISLNPVYIKTNDFLPGKVIGYDNQLVANDKIKKGSIVNLKIATKPDNALTHDPRVLYVSEISKLTGFDSPNGEILKEAGVYGTDLGIPVDLGNEIIYLFGDSFSGAGMKGMWYSNFIARTTDNSWDNDMKFDKLVTASNGAVLPFAQGAHQSGSIENTGSEVTKIPTGGIKINNTVYVFYMSIRYWGVGGSWLVNYNQCIKSEDLENWTNVNSLRFNESEASNFGQVFPFKDPNSNYIYLYGIPGGRNGGCVLARTTEDNFESRSNYEYLTAKDTWTKGDIGLNALNLNPYYIVSPGVAELSVIYNSYLGKYVMTFFRNSKIVMLQALKPDEIFKDPITLLTQENYKGIYGGFMLQNYQKENGKCFYITVSSWKDYNVYWLKVVLK